VGGRLDLRRQGSVAEDAQRADVLAACRPAGTARAADTALRVGIDGHALSHREPAAFAPTALMRPMNS
jgi:hypothetical protein